MLLIDMSNLVFSTVIDYHNKTKEQADISLLRHLIITKLITEKNRLKDYADEIVLCFDSRKYWRKAEFAYYKAKRKKARDDSSMDWDAFFVAYDRFKEELREYFPVKCIEVLGAEADDVMAILAMRYGNSQKVCIASSDKDLIQIQQNICSAVKQWSFFHKKFITPKNAEYDLFEHVVRGDTGDGIPNILSADNVLVEEGIRQKPLAQKKIDVWKDKGGVLSPEDWAPDFDTLAKFHRNRTLIDLRRIPDQLAIDIVKAYDEAPIPTGKMFTYLTANRLTRIMAQGGF